MGNGNRRRLRKSKKSSRENQAQKGKKQSKQEIEDRACHNSFEEHEEGPSGAGQDHSSSSKGKSRRSLGKAIDASQEREKNDDWGDMSMAGVEKHDAGEIDSSGCRQRFEEMFDKVTSQHQINEKAGDDGFGFELIKDNVGHHEDDSDSQGTIDSIQDEINYHSQGKGCTEQIDVECCYWEVSKEKPWDSLSSQVYTEEKGLVPGCGINGGSQLNGGHVSQRSNSEKQLEDSQKTGWSRRPFKEEFSIRVFSSFKTATDNNNGVTTDRATACDFYLLA